MEEFNCIISEIIATKRKFGCIFNFSPIWKRITALVDGCMIPRLSVPYDDLSKPVDHEYSFYKVHCQDKLYELCEILSNLENRYLKRPCDIEFTSSLMILVEQINSKGPWGKVYANVHSKEIVDWLDENFSISNCEDEKYVEDLFELCMKKIHKFLTPDLWKHYPALVASYRGIVRKFTKAKRINCSLHVVFPATFLQMEDYNRDDKREGLKCCAILLKATSFSLNGYEDVVMESLSKLLTKKETESLTELIDCITIMLLIRKEECNRKWSKSDDIFENVLDTIWMDGHKDRKSIYLKSLPNMMDTLEISVIKWKDRIMRQCCEEMANYLCFKTQHEDVNSCLEIIIAFIQVGWPVWSYNCDHYVLIALFKLLYLVYDDKTVGDNLSVKNLGACIITILSLYTKPQRQNVFNKSGTDIKLLENEKFLKKWNNLERLALNSEMC